MSYVPSEILQKVIDNDDEDMFIFLTKNVGGKFASVQYDNSDYSDLMSESKPFTFKSSLDLNIKTYSLSYIEKQFKSNNSISEFALILKSNYSDDEIHDFLTSFVNKEPINTIFFLIMNSFPFHNDIFIDRIKRANIEEVTKYCNDVLFGYFSLINQHSINDVFYLKRYASTVFYEYLNSVQFKYRDNQHEGTRITGLSNSSGLFNHNYYFSVSKIIDCLNLDYEKAKLFFKNFLEFSIKHSKELVFIKSVYYKAILDYDDFSSFSSLPLLGIITLKNEKGEIISTLTKSEREILELKGFILLDNVDNLLNKKSTSICLLRKQISTLVSMKENYDKQVYFTFPNFSFLSFLSKDECSLDFVFELLNLKEKSVFSNINQIINFDLLMLLNNANDEFFNHLVLDNGFISPDWHKSVSTLFSNLINDLLRIDAEK